MKRSLIFALSAIALTTATIPLASAETSTLPSAEEREAKKREKSREHMVDVYNTLISAYNAGKANLAKLRECDVDGVHNVDAKAEYHGTPGDLTFPIDDRFEGFEKVETFDALPQSVKEMHAAKSQEWDILIRRYGGIREGAHTAYERCDAKRNGRKVKWPISVFM